MSNAWSECHDNNELFKLCRKDALYTSTKQMMVKYFRAKMVRGEFDEQFWLDNPEIEQMCQFLKDIQKDEDTIKKDRIYLITVNLPTGGGTGCMATWHILLMAYKRLLTYKNVLSESVMVLEQRSSDEDKPYGYHMHIATKNTYGLTKSALIYRTFLAVKKECFIDSKSCIHVKDCKSAYEYCKGQKKSDIKHKKVLVDRALRLKYGYNDLYNGGDNIIIGQKN